MRKRRGKNIILIMSGGKGERFGADVPKQYCNMLGRPIIEYAIDASRFCASADEIIVVTSAEYKDQIHNKYGFPTVQGGSTRTESLANGLDYIAQNYDCEKVIITNAVCPLMTEEQLERYFSLLDEYDYVLTCWKVVSTLHRYDGSLVDRNDFFHVMEPEAYNFKILQKNYKRDYPVPYVFHQLPKEMKAYYCFDYPYTMKITYSTDVKIAEILYKDLILRPKQERIKHNIANWLSAYGNKDISKWIAEVPNYLNELLDRWEIVSYIINPKTFATCVFEAESNKYGSVIVKFHAPSDGGGRYDFELAYYKNANNNCMAHLLDYDDNYRVLLIKKITPGMQVKFDKRDIELKRFYDAVSNIFIPSKIIGEYVAAPTIMSEFEKNVKKSDMYNFELEFKHKMEDKVRIIWDKYFAGSPKYYLHRDLQRRNMLKGADGIYAIDPLGVLGPKEFEYTISFIIESKADSNNYKKIHNDMLEYFSGYCEKQRLYAALFITWVHKMDEYIYVKHDNFKLARWVMKVIKDIFFEGECWQKDGEEGMPKELRQ